MVNSITSPIQGDSSKSVSRFVVINASGLVIAESLPFSNAYAIARSTPNARIKFCRMMKKAGAK